MADTSTKVLTIDTGNAITNVKEFKERIEELKGALLGLEKGTDEYNAVAKELRDSQEKLTEVMDVAKGKAEGVEGSYDNLVATMRDLKKEWRATADEAERAQLGQQILEINNQLKDLDASTGNFQRNVGDYANAFEEAFKNVFQGIGQGNTALANSSKTIAKLIPLIKKATTTATVGLQGIQKAIVATGIGALVVAVGLLATNWDKVTEAVRESIPALKKQLDAEKEIEQVSESIKRIKEQSKEATDYEVRMMQARKASEKEILAYKIKQQKVEINRLQTQVEIAKNAWKELEAEREKGFLYKLSEKALGIYENHIDKAIQKAVDAYNTANAAVTDAKKNLDILETTLDNVDTGKTTGGSSSSKTDTAEAEKKRLEDIKKALEDAGKDEIQLLKEQYQEKIDLFEKYGEDTAALIAERDAKIKAIEDAAAAEKQAKEDEDAEKERKKLVAQTDKTIKEVQAQANNDENAINLKYRLQAAEDLASDKGGFFGNNDAFNVGKIKDAFQQEADRINGIFEIRKSGLEKEKSELESLIESLKPETEEYISAKERLAEVETELDNATTENHIENLLLADDEERKLAEARKQRMAAYSQGLTSIGGLISTISSLMEQQIQAEVEDGKISEKTAKERFESVKKMQIGAAVINMAAGVVSAIAQAQELGPIMGPIMAAINSAAVIAAGAVEISQIKRTKYGSDSSGNVTTPNLQRATNMVQIQPVQNITGQNETTELANAINAKPIVVKVSDIEDTEQIVSSTKVESTF